MASTASSSVTGSRGLMICHAGRSYRYDLPSSPRTKSPSQAPDCTISVQLGVDLLHQGQPLLGVERLRLLHHQLVDLLGAVAGEVPLRAAAVVLEQLRVGIVDTGAGEVERHLVLQARHLGMPHAGLDLLERGVDPDELQLV